MANSLFERRPDKNFFVNSELEKAYHKADDGEADIHIANPKKFKESVKAVIDAIKNDVFGGQVMPNLGTAALVAPVNLMGGFPTHNARKGVLEGWEKISGEAMAEIIKKRGGNTTAIFGAGTVGMSAILGAVIASCTTIVAIDLVPDRLELAKELGATHVINPKNSNPVDAIKDITRTGINYSLECVGNPAVLRQAVDSLGMMGVCGQVGAVPPGTQVTLNMDLIMNGRTVRGIFEDINKAVEDMEKGLVIKPILKP